MSLFSNINVKIDPKDKEKAALLFKQWGLNFSSAINAFIKQCINQGHMPFVIGKYDNNESSSKEEIKSMEK